MLAELRDADGRLLRTWKDGRGRLAAYLEDHAFLLEALIALYEATFDPRWYGEAVALADVLIERFADPERGGFFTTAVDHEPLAARRKDLEDSPIPSGNSAAAFGLLRLGLLSGDGRYEHHALGVLRLLFPLAARHPRRVRPPARRRRLLPGAGQGGGDRRPRARGGSAAARGPRRLPPARRARRRGRETGCRCWRAASRSMATPPLTCASSSPARRRLPSPDDLAAALDE